MKNHRSKKVKKIVVKCEKNEGRVKIRGWKPGKGQDM